MDRAPAGKPASDWRKTVVFPPFVSLFRTEVEKEVREKEKARTESERVLKVGEKDSAVFSNGQKGIENFWTVLISS